MVQAVCLGLLREADVSYDGSVIANRVPSEPFLINHFVGVLKPLGECSTIFLLSLNTVYRST